jgi:hypothetical protein
MVVQTMRVLTSDQLGVTNMAIKFKDNLIDEAYRVWCENNDDHQDVFTLNVEEVLNEIQDDVVRCVKDRIPETLIQKWMIDAVSKGKRDKVGKILRYVDDRIREMTYEVLSDLKWSSRDYDQ